MTEELFGERRRALEEEFFREENAKLLAAMRAKTEAKHVEEALRTAAGIADEKLAHHVREAGMTAATLTAASLVPLITVAWADGEIEERERHEILKDASLAHLDDASRALLSGWLETKPESALFDTWVEYVQDLLLRLDAVAIESLKSSTLAQAAGVAEAAGGGPYKIGRRTSKEEEAVLSRIAAAFEA